MRSGFLPFLSLALFLLLPKAPAAEAGELGINVYGLSYHFERDRAERLGYDNEVNPGLGMRYRAPLNERWDWFFDAGAYRDSGRNTALVIGPGAFWKATEGWRLGGAVAFFDSDTYNRGRSFVAPLPVVAYEWRAVTLNMVYIPKVGDLNSINTLGFWVTFWPRGF